MKVFIERNFNGLYKFVKNPYERKFVFYTIIYGSKKRYEEKKINFLNYKFRVPDALSFIWQFKEIFVEEFYKFKSESSEPVIYDCGSNIGMSCIYFKRIFPGAKIKAFEADPEISKYLKENLKANGLDNVEVIDKAVWKEDGEIDFCSEKADASTIFSSKTNLTVKSVRLKNLLEKEERIDMLKMDIEGAENDVILDCGNSLRVVNNIFIEYHSFTNSQQKLSELLNVLEQNNFRYFIRNDSSRNMPLINKTNKSNLTMDLQLNIFGYRD